MSSVPVRRVTIIQRILPHYRIPFFNGLYSRLREDSLDLRVIYGQELAGTTPKSIAVEADWAKPLHNRYLLDGRAVWQPCRRLVGASDLVILEHASSALTNYPLLLRHSAASSPRLALWGHGRNMRRTGGWSEAAKSWMTRRADWWFAYSAPGADVVAKDGFPQDRITVVDNAIDTTVLTRDLLATKERDKASLRNSLGLHGNRVGIYCGGLYAEKKLDFLIDACIRVRAHVPDFEMIFIGQGPEQYKVDKAAATHQWIHYAGPRFGAELAAYYSLASVLLMPGLVGLAIVDSFAAAIPLVTTDIPIHSPEIAYLERGVNGVMTAHERDRYAEQVVGLLRDEAKLAVLRRGCRAAARHYSLENMVERYAQGIRGCLNAEARRTNSAVDGSVCRRTQRSTGLASPKNPLA